MTDQEGTVDESAKQLTDEEILKIPSTTEELKQMLDAARLEGARLVGHTVANLLNNRLSSVSGLFELLEVYKIPLPTNLQPIAKSAQLGLQQAITTLQRLNRIDKLVKEPTLPGQPQALNLDASTQMAKPSTLEHRQHS